MLPPSRSHGNKQPRCRDTGDPRMGEKAQGQGWRLARRDLLHRRDPPQRRPFALGESGEDGRLGVPEAWERRNRGAATSAGPCIGRSSRTTRPAGGFPALRRCKARRRKLLLGGCARYLAPATVAALCDAAVPIPRPFADGGRRKRLMVLVAMALMLAMMLASSGTGGLGRRAVERPGRLQGQSEGDLRHRHGRGQHPEARRLRRPSRVSLADAQRRRRGHGDDPQAAAAGVFILPHLHPAPQPIVFHASSHRSGYHALRSALATIYARSRIRTSEN